MRALSISAAWEESKAILARDGRLLVIVALALIALPSALNGLVNPGGLTGRSSPLWMDILALIASLIALAGQLALIRLALGPSITVGGAIAHGIRRMPIYLLSVIAVLIGLMIAAVPFVLLLSVLGVPLQASAGVPPRPASILVGLAYVAVVVFIGVRFLLSSPVASAEHVGPIAILRRSWDLTAGHWWQLFGFVFMILVSALILLIAVGSAIGVIINLLFGPIDPMSAAALVLALVQSLVSAVITTLFAVMLARIYLQLSGAAGAHASVPRSGT